MATVTVSSSYEPDRIAAQKAFHESTARLRLYGGAMGGGKSRALCEEAFVLGLKHPGLKTLICRLAHTSIIETTKKTFVEQVLPPEFLAQKVDATKASQGEDWIRLYNGSTYHFIGLEDPVRWFSSEIGLLVFDEAHEIPVDTVLQLMTRLRQPGMPHKVLVAANPENPGHWIQRWFILGGEQTDYGFYKPALYATDDAEKPLGDAEFFFAKAVDNPFLPDGYIDMALASLPPFLRRRYLEGEWLHISGTCYFDIEALGEYYQRLKRPKWQGRTAGDVTGKDAKDKIRIQVDKNGPLHVWASPVREHEDEKTGKTVPAHRYLITVDVSSGGSTDFSAVQVIDVEEFTQVAEFQGKLDPDLLALEAFRLGKVYNDALIAPEITGGWGFSVVRELQRLGYKRLYTRRVMDRLTDKWTDKVGWDTTSKTRAYMLDTLERVLREREFGLVSERSHQELGTFVRDENGKPQAQPGCTDDLVIALAMGVTLAQQMPRTQVKVRPEKHTPQFAATGW